MQRRQARAGKKVVPVRARCSIKKASSPPKSVDVYDHVEGDSVEPLIRNDILDYRLVRCIRQDKWVGVALYGSLSVSVHPVGNLAPDGEIPGFHSDGVHRPCCRRQKMIVSFDYVSTAISNSLTIRSRRLPLHGPEIASRSCSERTPSP